MGRIASHHKLQTRTYRDMVCKSIALVDVNDCAVKAVAVVTGLDYVVVHKAFEEAGRKKGKGVHTYLIHEVVRAFGFDLVNVNPREAQKGYDRKKTGGYIYKNLTTHHFALYPEVWQDGHAYLAYSKAHVSGVVNGEVHDWCKGRSKHIYSIYRVIKK